MRHPEIIIIATHCGRLIDSDKGTPAVYPLSQQFDYLALLEPTSPLRSPGDIDAAIRALLDAEDRSGSLVSLGEVHMEHPSIVKRVSDGYVVPYIEESPNVTRRQDLAPAYFPYGVIYLSRIDDLLRTRSFYQRATIPYFIERSQNFEVDDELDLVCVEAVLRHRAEGSE
jgi:N-acylneuraminate cytidylyltransferase